MRMTPMIAVARRAPQVSAHISLLVWERPVEMALSPREAPGQIVYVRTSNAAARALYAAAIQVSSRYADATAQAKFCTPNVGASRRVSPGPGHPVRCRAGLPPDQDDGDGLHTRRIAKRTGPYRKATSCRPRPRRWASRTEPQVIGRVRALVADHVLDEHPPVPRPARASTGPRRPPPRRDEARQPVPARQAAHQQDGQRGDRDHLDAQGQGDRQARGGRPAPLGQQPGGGEGQQHEHRVGVAVEAGDREEDRAARDEDGGHGRLAQRPPRPQQLEDQQGRQDAGQDGRHPHQEPHRQPGHVRGELVDPGAATSRSAAGGCRSRRTGRRKVDRSVPVRAGRELRV